MPSIRVPFFFACAVAHTPRFSSHNKVCSLVVRFQPRFTTASANSPMCFVTSSAVRPIGMIHTEGRSKVATSWATSSRSRVFWQTNLNVLPGSAERLVSAAGTILRCRASPECDSFGETLNLTPHGR